MQNSLDDESALPELAQDRLAGPFAHVIVGDRAQSRHGFTDSRSRRERMSRVGITNVTQKSLTVNYRTPEKIMSRRSRLFAPSFPTHTLRRRPKDEVFARVISACSLALIADDAWRAYRQRMCGADIDRADCCLGRTLNHVARQSPKQAPQRADLGY